MPSLETHLDSLNYSAQLQAIKNLLISDSAQAKVTFWGSRVVEVNGFTGSAYLADILKKILATSYQRRDADDLTAAERISGVEIVKKLQRFYTDTDDQLKNSNLLTKILNWIREFSFIPYSDRFFLADGTIKDNFCAYSPSKFIQEFGRAPDHSDGFLGKWRVAGENQIRALPVRV